MLYEVGMDPSTRNDDLSQYDRYVKIKTATDAIEQSIDSLDTLTQSEFKYFWNEETKKFEVPKSVSKTHEFTKDLFGKIVSEKAASWAANLTAKTVEAGVRQAYQLSYEDVVSGLNTIHANIIENMGKIQIELVTGNKTFDADSLKKINEQVEQLTVRLAQVLTKTVASMSKIYSSENQGGLQKLASFIKESMSGGKSVSNQQKLDAIKKIVDHLKEVWDFRTATFKRDVSTILEEKADQQPSPPLANRKIEQRGVEKKKEKQIEEEIQPHPLHLGSQAAPPPPPAPQPPPLAPPPPPAFAKRPKQVQDNLVEKEEPQQELSPEEKWDLKESKRLENALRMRANPRPEFFMEKAGAPPRDIQAADSSFDKALNKLTNDELKIVLIMLYEFFGNKKDDQVTYQKHKDFFDELSTHREELKQKEAWKHFEPNNQAWSLYLNRQTGRADKFIDLLKKRNAAGQDQVYEAKPFDPNAKPSVVIKAKDSGAQKVVFDEAEFRKVKLKKAEPQAEKPAPREEDKGLMDRLGEEIRKKRKDNEEEKKDG